MGHLTFKLLSYIHCKYEVFFILIQAFLLILLEILFKKCKQYRVVRPVWLAAVVPGASVHLFADYTAL